MGQPLAHVRPRSRPAAVVCGLVALSLAAGAFAGTANAAPRAGAPPTTATTPPADPRVAAEKAATAQARSTGQDTPVPELTTETDTVTAKPDGTLALKRTVEPSRTKKSGTWRDLDPTLTRAGDGTVRPASTTTDLALGGGGSRLLASMTNGGRKLTFTWPTALPAPVLAGDGALYPGVLPDVDLKVSATEQGGFSHTLIVKTAAAATNPQLATLKLGMSADGLSVGENGDGTLAARTADGKAVFTAPAPAMWDSRTTPKQAPAGSAKTAAAVDTAEDPSAPIPAGELVSTDRRPGVHATTAPLDAAVAAGSLTLTPDTGLLHAPDTVFPLYIDPAWIPLRDNVSLYGWVQDGSRTTVGYGRTDYQPGVGYQHWRAPIGLERTFYRVDYNWQGRLNGKAIKRVTFNTTQVDSAVHDCSPTVTQPVYLHLTSDTLTQGTNWNNQPTDQGLWGTANVASSSVDDKCGNRPVDFDITANLAGHQNWEFITFGVYGKENPQTTTNNGFKRFSRTAADNFIYIEYNTKPNTPTDLHMTPEPVNGEASGNCGYVGAVNPVRGGVSLFATLSDPDGHDVVARFAVNEVGNGDPLVYDSSWVSAGPSGHVARADIPVGTLLGGRTYKWAVVSDDDDLESNWINGCTFTVDDTPPPAPVAIPSIDFPVNGGGRHAGEKGTFTFTATDVGSGVDRVEYSLGGTIPVGGADRAQYDPVEKVWKIKDLPVLDWGGQRLFAQTVDKAGNTSQQTAYTFYVPADPNHETKLGDIDGDRRPDLVVVDNAGALRMYGANTAPTPGGTLVSEKVQGPPDSSGRPTWTNVSITHRGGQGIGRDDLYAHADGELYIYRSGAPGANHQYFVSNRSDPVIRPDLCLDPTRANNVCARYDNDWTRVTQILAPGNVDNDLDRQTARLDLLTLENDTTGKPRLWLFHGDTSPGSFDYARPLGDADWTGLDLIAPGDVNGDDHPDLWARDRTTGFLYQYASRKKPDGTIDLAALGDAAARTRIGIGFDPALYPKVSSDGDLDGDGRTDLWAQSADGTLYTFRGQAPDATGSLFAPAALIADTKPWAECAKFPSAGNAAVQIELCGPILAKYQALGGPTGRLHLPIGPVTQDGSGKYVNFQGDSGNTTDRASIHWSPLAGAWSVQGDIRAAWLAQGGTSGTLGYPVSDEDIVKDGAGTHIGSMSRFTGTPATGPGVVTWTPTGGAHTLNGDIFQRWQAMNGPRGVLGFPTTDILPTAPQKPGSYAHFSIPGANGDTASIYRSDATGAWPVWGSIRGTWAAQGWETGPLGFPTSAEYGVMAGASSNFEGGHIRWNMHTGGTTVYPGVDETPMGRTMLSGDFDGDGRSDVATVVDFGGCATGWFTQLRRADGSLGEPRQSHVQPAGTFCQGDAKYAAGDFDGDGRADIAALYHYGNGHVRVFTYLANAGGDGGFHPGGAGWEHPAGWDFDRTTLLAGDTTGDKRADLVLVQGYADGRISTHSLPAAAGGVFATLVNGWVETNPDWWRYQNARYTLGDLNGDGRADLGAVYVHDTGEAKAFGFITAPDGTIPAPVASWSAPGAGWNIAQLQAVAADTNGDKHADIVLMFDQGGAQTTLRTLLAKSDGTLNAPFASWDSGAGNWEAPRAAPLAGDTDGDGRTDITAVYDYGTTRWAAYTFTAKTDGGLNTYTKSWEAQAGIW
ncbi:LGFP repeat-containing protein [Embleya sp. NPDC059237]|uniref:LGFP repeat-containing protein n=1 Tax=Embleya sp. NPDC059237 TaxID=3346784 RepID=UPI00369FE349